MSLSKQQREPHPRLAAVRQRLERLGLNRIEASRRCEAYTDEQCDQVLAASGEDAIAKAAGIDPAVAQQLAKDKLAKCAERLVTAGFVASLAGHLTAAERDAVLQAASDVGVAQIVASSPDPQIKAVLDAAHAKASAKAERAAAKESK